MGGSGADLLDGQSGADHLEADQALTVYLGKRCRPDLRRSWWDEIVGRNQNDILLGGGDDILGGNGRDALSGSDSKHDLCVGGAGTDTAADFTCEMLRRIP